MTPSSTTFNVKKGSHIRSNISTSLRSNISTSAMVHWRDGDTQTLSNAFAGSHNTIEQEQNHIDPSQGFTTELLID